MPLEFRSLERKRDIKRKFNAAGGGIHNENLSIPRHFSKLRDSDSGDTSSSSSTLLVVAAVVSSSSSGSSIVAAVSSSSSSSIVVVAVVVY